jgi:hypothetical protein
LEIPPESPLLGEIMLAQTRSPISFWMIPRKAFGNFNFDDYAKGFANFVLDASTEGVR